MTDQRTQKSFAYTGLTAGLHAKQLINAPGQKSLTWRLGTAKQFFREMTERLKVTTQVGELIPNMDQLKSLEVDGKLPKDLQALLANLVTDPTTDWAAALIDAWSIIGDVLCFYQERLINEGFIDTATQPDSIALLNATLGLNQSPLASKDLQLSGKYQFPGAAGSAEVIATVKGGKGMPGSSLIKANSALRRVTPSGGEITYFLVKSDTEIRSEWNELYPFKANPAQKTNDSYHPGAGDIFELTKKKIKPGALLAVTGSQNGQNIWYLMETKSVRTDSSQHQTTITWNQKAKSSSPVQGLQNEEVSKADPGIQDPRFYELSQTVYAFGNKAPLLSTEPLSRRLDYISSGGFEEWKPQETDSTEPKDEKTPTATFNDGLPPYSVNDFLVAESGILYLATEKGVFFRTSVQAPWTSSSQGLFKRSILTLMQDGQGNIYAGTVGGGVYRSLVGGTAWSALPGGYIMQPGKLKNGPSLRTSLPATTVNRLALGEQIVPLATKDAGKKPLASGLVLAATDNGLFRNDQTGAGWFNVPLANQNAQKTAKSGGQPQSPTPILDIKLAVHHNAAFIVFATDGLLHVAAWPKNIKPKKPKTKKSPSAKAGGHGPAHIPNIIIVLFDTFFAAIKTALLPIEKTLKTTCTGIKKSYLGVKKALEWITRVDPRHWSDVKLPYPDSKVPFNGKFINFQLVPLTTGKLEGETFLALSTSAGIFIFNAKSGKMSSWSTGLPTSDQKFGALSTVADPEKQSGAILLTVCDHKVFGFVPTGDLDKSGLPDGTWKALIEFPAATETPSKVPEIPRRALCGSDGSIFVSRALELMSDWPNFNFGDASGSLDQIDVVGLKGIVSPNMVGMLVSETGKYICPFQIHSANKIMRRDFGLKATVTRLKISLSGPAFDPQKFNRRTTKILIGNSEIFAAQLGGDLHSTVTGDALKISNHIAGLAKRKLSITGAAARALVIPLGGIQAWEFSNGRAEKTGQPMLPFTNITGLASPSKDLYLALSPEGVWQADTSLDWKPAITGLEPDDTIALQVTALADASLLLLTSKNLYGRAADGDVWAKKAAPASHKNYKVFLEIEDPELHPDNKEWLLGTSGSGLFQSSDFGKSWSQVSWVGLPVDAYVTSIQQTSTGEIFVGMDGDGLVKANPSLTLWHRVQTPPALNRVSLIRRHGDSLILSNTSGDLYSLAAKSRKSPITGLSSTSGQTQILDLVINGQTWIAGLKGGGVILSNNAGIDWQAMETGANNQVQALLNYNQKWLIGTAPETILAGPNSEQVIASKKLFSLPATPYAEQLNKKLASADFLALFKQAKLKPPKNPYVQIVTSGISWLLSSAPASGTPSKPSSSYFLHKNGNQLTLCQNGAELSVVEYGNMPKLGTQQYTLALDDGSVATINCWPEEAFSRPALKTDPKISQTTSTKAAKVEQNEPCTALVLTDPIKQLLDADTITYCANILPLAQGQLVKDEILGDSNPLVAFQSFPLKTGQLVFERLDAEIVKPVLKVTVNGLAFEQVENFADDSQNHRAYILTLDDKGMGTVTFNDCQDSALQVAGSGNVRATYRANMANFDSNDTKAQYILVEPPYGVSTITTPVSQSAPELAKAATARKKENFHFPDRLITYSDFECLAEGLPNIGKSKLLVTTERRRKTLSLFVAGTKAKQLASDDPLLSATTAKIGRINLEPQLPVKVLPATLRPFAMKAAITLEDGASQSGTASILARAYQKLDHKFGFGAMAIGQSIKITEVERVLMAVPQVSNVRVEELYFADKPPSRQDLKTEIPGQTQSQILDLIFLSTSANSVNLIARNFTGKNVDQSSFPDPDKKTGDAT